MVVASLSWMQAQAQLSQSPDVQPLRNKLQQLEQEMNELKGQINAIEHLQNVTAPIPAPGGAATQGKAEGVPQEKADQSSIDLYGFIMLDSGYDFKTNNPDWFDVVRPTQLPSSSGEFAPDGKAYFGTRQTRFGLKTSTPTGLGNLKTQFEFELFGLESTKDKQHSVCGTPMENSDNSERVKLGARSWTLTSSPTPWSTGARTEWSSSAMCRSDGCQSAVITPGSLSRWSDPAPALIRVSKLIVLNCKVSSRSLTCPTFPGKHA
jgi:hypothetical protein